MTVTEIAHAGLAANNLTDVATRKQRLGIESGIRAALEGHAGKTVERVGGKACRGDGQLLLA